MALASRYNYDASWIDHVLNPTIGLPAQIIGRLTRAAQEDDVDLFSRQGLWDPALIPFIGGFYSQKNAVGMEEMAERVAEPLGFDSESFAVQFGTAILTDPLIYMTLGTSAAGRLAAGVQAHRKALGKVGHMLPSGGETVGDFLKAAKEADTAGLSRWGRSRAAKRVAAIEKTLEKRPELAKRSLTSLTEEGSREVAAIALPLPYASRVSIKLPGLKKGWRDALTKPIRTAAMTGFELPATATRFTGSMVGKASGAFGLGVDGQRGLTDFFEGVANTLSIPTDFLKGLGTKASDRINVTSAMGVTLRALSEDPEVASKLAVVPPKRPELAKLIERATGSDPAFARMAARIIRDSGGPDQPVLGTVQDLLAGKTTMVADIPTTTIADPYLARMSDDSIEGFTEQARRNWFERGNRLGNALFKAFRGRTGDRTIDAVLRERLPLMGESSRFYGATAQRVGKLYRLMAEEAGLENTEQVDDVFKAIFQILPQESDDFMIDRALTLFDDEDALGIFGEHVDNYVSRLMHVSRFLDGVAPDPMSAQVQKGWKSLFPEIKEIGGGLPVQKFLAEVSDPLRGLSRDISKISELQHKVRVLKGPEQWAAKDDLQKLRSRIEGNINDLRESMPALREELFRRGQAVFTNPNGKWHLPGEAAGSKAAMLKRAAAKGGKAVPVGAKAFSDVYEIITQTSADNLRISSSMGMTAAGSHPMAYVPRVLSARERNALDNILSSTEWDASQFQIYASAGSKGRKLDFVTTDTLEQILFQMHKQGQGVGKSKAAQQALDMLNAGGNTMAASPVSAALARATEYKYFEDTGKMLDEILVDTTGDFGNMMGGKLPPGFSSVLGGGRVTGIKTISYTPAVKYVKGEPQVQKMVKRAVEIETVDGKTIQVPLSELEKVGVTATFVGAGPTPGKAMMMSAARGQAPVKLTDLDPEQLLRLENMPDAQIIFGQGSTVKAVEVAAKKELEAVISLPQWMDSVHRLVKMGVTTGNASFHVMNLASAVPLAQANGLDLGSLIRGTAAAVGMLWRTPSMQTANRQISALFGDTAPDGSIHTGFAEFIHGMGKVGLGTGVGYGVDQLRGEEGLGPGAGLGATLGGVAMLSRGSGAALARSIESRTLRETGELAFHTADGSYTMKEVLEEGSRHGLLNTFVESGTQALTAESKALQDMIFDESSGWDKVMNALSDAGQQSEITARLSIMFGFLHQGLSPAQAARKTAATLFDYNDLTPIEQHFFKRISSFYTFGKKIIENSYESYLRDPQKIQRMMHLVHGHGDTTYGEDGEVFLDTSLGRANLQIGDRTINVGRALPQLDVVNAIGFGMEFLSRGSNIGGLRRGSVADQTVRSLLTGKEAVTMAPETPGILSGNVALSGDPPSDVITGNWLLDKTNAAVSKTLLLRSVIDLFDEPDKTGKTVMDDAEDAMFNAFGLSSEESVKSRKRFLRSRADQIDRDLQGLLRRQLAPGVREQLQELLRKNRLRRQTLNILQ